MCIRDSYKIPSNAGLATSAKREVPRAAIAERLLWEKNGKAVFRLTTSYKIPSSGRSRFSKNFSFWKVSLIYYAMFKIKSLQCKDLILNSTGCRKSNRLLRQPAHYRIFASQKYAAVLPRCDTASMPCIERSEAFCTGIAERLLSQSAHKCRALYP